MNSNNSISIKNLKALDNELGFKTNTAHSPIKQRRNKNRSAKNAKALTTNQSKKIRGKHMSLYQQNLDKVMKLEQHDQFSPEMQISHKQVALVSQYI